MNVWRILAGFAGWRLALSAVTGLAGGAALAALIRLVHRVLTLPTVELAAAGLQFAGLLAAYFVGTIIAEHALNDTAERLQWELRRSLLRQVLARPLRQLEQLGVSRLFGILGGDVKIIADYVCWLPTAVVNLAVVAGCFAYMAWLSPLVLVFNVVFVALAAACYLIPQRKVQAIHRRAAQRWDDHVGQLHFSLHGLRSLLLNRKRRADFVTTHFEPTGAEVWALNRRGRFIHLLTERFAEAFALANIACLLFVLPRFLTLTPATATGLLLAALFVRGPLKDLLHVFPRTEKARLSLQRMGEAGLDPTARVATDAGVPAAEPAGDFRELTLREATFRYESDHDQRGFGAGPFSLTVRAGEIIFIVGGNGAGKTTLAKLLCGLYAPDAGTVILNGKAVTDEAARDVLRRQFSAVFTEDPLFSHVLGMAPSEAAARGPALLGELQLASKVSLDGTRFSTTDLSQGQRRRLVLLGALLEERPVLLLDEWAADQDPQFRTFFYDHLIPSLRARGRTLIVITHDDRYFDRADRVLKLESGRLASQP